MASSTQQGGRPSGGKPKGGKSKGRSRVRHQIDLVRFACDFCERDTDHAVEETRRLPRLRDRLNPFFDPHPRQWAVCTVCGRRTRFGEHDTAADSERKVAPPRQVVAPAPPRDHDDGADAEPPGRRPVVWVLAAAAVIVVLAVAWVGFRAMQAKRHLTLARSEVTSLKQDLFNGDAGQVRRQLAAVQAETRAARRETSDPVWAAVSAVPYAGRSAATIRDISAAVDDLAQQALPAVVQAGAGLSPARLRVAPNQIALAPLEKAAAPLASADQAMQAVVAKADRSPGSLLIPPVADARTKLLDQLHSFAGSVDDAARFARIGPAMLGADGTRRYFLGFQNNAEARGTGGLVGAFAILEATDGKIKVTRTGSDAQLHNPVGADRLKVLGTALGSICGGFNGNNCWLAGNDSPNFADAAQIWKALWQADPDYGHQRIDGVLALDPPALSHILSATGPAQVRPGITATSSNVVALTEQQAYVLFPGTATDQRARKKFLLDVTSAVIAKVFTGAGSPHALVSALGRSAGERRLLLWSDRPDEEAVLAPTPLAGLIPDTPGPFAGVFVVNRAGGKLDYYLGRSLTYTADGCSGRQRSSSITVRLTNGAPTSGLPAYVRSRVDVPKGAPVPYAQNRLQVSVYATRGAALTGATLDGNPTTLAASQAYGHLRLDTEFTLDAGQTRVLVVHLSEPTAPGRVMIVQQPLVKPQQTVVDIPRCGR